MQVTSLRWTVCSHHHTHAGSLDMRRTSGGVCAEVREAGFLAEVA